MSRAIISSFQLTPHAVVTELVSVRSYSRPSPMLSSRSVSRLRSRFIAVSLAIEWRTTAGYYIVNGHMAARRGTHSSTPKASLEH